jgi:hypothetical protein
LKLEMFEPRFPLAKLGVLPKLLPELIPELFPENCRPLRLRGVAVEPPVFEPENLEPDNWFVVLKFRCTKFELLPPPPDGDEKFRTLGDEPRDWLKLGLPLSPRDEPLRLGLRENDDDPLPLRENEGLPPRLREVEGLPPPLRENEGLPPPRENDDPPPPPPRENDPPPPPPPREKEPPPP